MTFCQLDESKKRLSIKGESGVVTLAEITGETIKTVEL